MSWLLGVDVGGTFTDVVAIETESGRTRKVKVPGAENRTPTTLGDGFERLGLRPEAVQRFAHGTTVTTNLTLERAGARVGLLTTAGFEDILEIGRIDRAHNYDLRWDKPVPLVPRELRLGVRERLDSAGEVVVALDEDGVREAAARLRELGAEAVAICFIGSYANPEHERRAGELVAQEWPGVHVSVSCDVMREYREFERTSTVAVDAYVKPGVDAYMDALETTLERLGVGARVEIMKSSGGVMSVQDTLEAPVNTLMSGPAGGVVAARHFASRAGVEDIITLDMGGTSADVALVRGGQPAFTSQYEIEWGVPVNVPMLDIRTIGAGGGSVARVDAGGRLKVGPQSAGAIPGPACYGRGGEEPTVTDANLLLGYLNPDYFVGGDVALDRDAAERSIERLAEALGLDAVATATGIVDLANANMVNLLRQVSVQRGHDPRDFTLVAFGGGGAVHAAALAQALHMGGVLVPPAPGLLSAVGLILAEPRHDFVQTLAITLEDLEWADLADALADLERRGRELLRRAGIEERAVTEATADMRYARQNYTIPVALDDLASVADLEGRFHASYDALYGYRMDDQPAEVVNLRVGVRAARALPMELQEGTEAAPARSAQDVRPVFFAGAGGFVETPVLQREALAPGATLPSPCVVEQPDTTIVVSPGFAARVDDAGNVRLTQET